MNERKCIDCEEILVYRTDPTYEGSILNLK